MKTIFHTIAIALLAILMGLHAGVIDHRAHREEEDAQ